MKQILSLLLVIAGATPVLTAADSLKAGQALPKLAPLLAGAKLPDTSGKVVLVDFWASWCVPCKASFPALNKLQADQAAKGLVIIAIGVDDDAADFKKFAAAMQAKFPLVHDAAHQAVGAFNPPTMPTSYLVDRKGVIRYVHSGFKGAKTEKEYTAEIETLLGEAR